MFYLVVFHKIQRYTRIMFENELTVELISYLDDSRYFDSLVNIRIPLIITRTIIKVKRVVAESEHNGIYLFLISS